MNLMDDIREVIEDFVRRKRSGSILVRRKAFGDPVLTAYFYRGNLLYATSFVVRKAWWEGFLKDEEVSLLSEGDNLIHYAARRYGERYVEHMVSHAKEVVREALRVIRENGWEVYVEMRPMDDEEVEHMFGLDIVREVHRSEKKEKESPPPSGPARSIVLSLISRSTPVEERPRREEKKVPATVLKAKALGFFILYAPGEDREAFLSTLEKFDDTLMDEFPRIREALKVVRGPIALIFPLFALVRFGSGEEEIWGITSDARKVAYALKYMEEVKVVPEGLLASLSDRYGTNFVWREGETVVVFGKCGKKRITVEEFIETYTGYFETFRRLVDEAVSKMPLSMPMRLKKILILRMLRDCPSPDEFRKKFYAKFGVSLS